jgi:hypothetical protein
MNDIVIIFVAVFVTGFAVGLIVARYVTEKKERDYLLRMEDIANRGNDILDDFKDVISFNNKLAVKNQELEDQLTTFLNEWN